MRILFVTWDGPQVSYLESLFLPIFVGLKEYGAFFDVLQFRWGDQASEKRTSAICKAAGIGYRSASVQRWGGGAGPFLSAALGARHVRAAVRHFNCDVIMPRSLMPAIAVLRAGGCDLRPIIFDADGLAADERVELAGLSAQGATYRILRDVEAQIIRHSRAVVTRSERSAEILFHRAGPPVSYEAFHVVTNGRDENLFHPRGADARHEVRRELGVANAAPLIVYAGSLGPQYGLEAMASLFEQVRHLRPDARLLVMTGSPERASAALRNAGAIVIRTEPGQVPRYLAAADAGLAYRANNFSMQGVAPVKLSEYLLCGLPVIGTGAIGDTGTAIQEGVFFNDEGGSRTAARWFVDTVLPDRDIYRAKASAIGRKRFSLRRSIDDYARALNCVHSTFGNGSAELQGRSTDDLEAQWRN